MASDLSKPSKPRPTGRRRTTAAQLQATSHLTGALPALDKGQVLAAFKAAAPALGIGTAVVHTMDLLFGFSWTIDWQQGWPRLVWPSQEVLIAETGLTLSGMKARIRRCIDLGLVRANDIGTGRRWGKRDKRTNRILQACGLDLSPMGERLAEWLTAAAEYEARREETKALRGECSAYLRSTLSLLDYASENGLPGADWQRLADDARQIAAMARNRRDPLQIAPLKSRLRLLLDQVQVAVLAGRAAVDHVNSNPQGSLTCLPTTTTNELKIAKATAAGGVRPAKEAGGVVGGSEDTRPSGVRSGRSAEADLLRGFPMSPSVLLNLVPAYRDWVNTSTPSWGQVADACDLVRQHMGISTHLYAQTRLVLGVIGASVAIGTVATKHEAGLVRNPGGYLRRMLEKHHAGELRLDKTLYGLADAAGRPGRAKRRAEAPAGAFGRLLS
ncbi:plasmid replication protein RepC [Roseomonas mucosa]|uniref:plasmid replication protein RepC n=1 Tax=Roseomonas mucosa TaxID=207340 RepID=UPI0028CE147A|nr:plasmid replication protein RepC [Roseomonas mucosa]MDT8278529.1 plasmid replication protein RepC [Roseomonas mucosa]